MPPRLKRGKVDSLRIHEIIDMQIHRAIRETPPRIGETIAESIAGAIAIGVDKASEAMKDYLETEGIPVD